MTASAVPTRDPDPSVPLDLPAGLRAWAEESPRHQRRLLNQVAQRLESGQAWPEALDSGTPPLPSYLRHLLHGAWQRGQLLVRFQELLQTQSRWRQMLRGLGGQLIYPGILLVLLMVAVVIIDRAVLPEIIRLVRDWQTDLNPTTVRRQPLWFAFHDWMPLVGGTLAGLAAISATACWLFPTAASRALESVPLVGPALRKIGLWRLVRLLRLAIDQAVPLDQALTWTADSLGHRALASDCRRLAELTRQGHALSAAVLRLNHLPELNPAMLAWGEAQACLSDALACLEHLAAERVQQQLNLVRLALVPLILVLVALVIGMLYSMIVWPMLESIEALASVA